MGLHETKKLLHSENYQQLGRQPTKWKKVFPNQHYFLIYSILNVCSQRNVFIVRIRYLTFVTASWKFFCLGWPKIFWHFLWESGFHVCDLFWYHSVFRPLWHSVIWKYKPTSLVFIFVNMFSEFLNWSCSLMSSEISHKEIKLYVDWHKLAYNSWGKDSWKNFLKVCSCVSLVHEGQCRVLM